MLVELLHRVAEMEQSEEDERVYYHRPSMSGPDRCLRQMVYLARGEEHDKEFSGRILHVFNDGHWHEELTNEWIGKTAFTLHSSQMKVSVSMLGLTVPGRIDGILTDIMGVDRLYEHKGLNTFTFGRYMKHEVFPEDYLTQTAIYIRGVQEVNPDIREALLVIKDKNNASFLEYLLSYDRETDTMTLVKLTDHLGEVIPLHTEKTPHVREKIVQKAFEKFLSVDQHKAAGTLPERPYESDSWQCGYCIFQNPCWASYSEEVEALAESADLDPELADEVRYYKELSAEITDQEKVKKALRDKLLAIMQEKKAKQGKAGEYLVKMSISPTKKLGDLPEAVDRMLDKYRVDGWMTKLTVSKLPPPKEVKPKKAKKKKEGSNEPIVQG